MKTTKKMTKKAFKELCSFHVYGYRNPVFNAIYFDHNGTGYKYAICENRKGLNKQQLFDLFYDWVILGKEKAPFAFSYTKYAENDNERFKVPLALDFNTWN